MLLFTLLLILIPLCVDLTVVNNIIEFKCYLCDMKVAMLVPQNNPGRIPLFHMQIFLFVGKKKTTATTILLFGSWFWVKSLFQIITVNIYNI